MRGVFFRRLAFVALLFVLLLTMPVSADSGADSGLWPQFVAWLDARTGLPIGASSGSVTFDEWLVLMARIGIPIG